MKHLVDIHCPPNAQGDDGQPRGNDGVIRRDVPCEIVPVSGVESPVAEQQTGITSYQIRLYGDPNRKITTRHHLTLGPRKFSIQSIDDPSMFQLGELTLVCGERNP